MRAPLAEDGDKVATSMAHGFRRHLPSGFCAKLIMRARL